MGSLYFLTLLLIPLIGSSESPSTLMATGVSYKGVDRDPSLLVSFLDLTSGLLSQGSWASVASNDPFDVSWGGLGGGFGPQVSPSSATTASALSLVAGIGNQASALGLSPPSGLAIVGSSIDMGIPLGSVCGDSLGGVWYLARYAPRAYAVYGSLTLTLPDFPAPPIGQGGVVPPPNALRSPR